MSADHVPSRRALFGASLAALAAPAAAAARPKDGKDRNKDKDKSTRKKANAQAKSNRRPKPALAAVIATITSARFENTDKRFTVDVAIDGQDFRSDPPTPFNIDATVKVEFVPAGAVQAELISRIQDAVVTDGDIGSGLQPSRISVLIVSGLA